MAADALVSVGVVASGIIIMYTDGALSIRLSDWVSL